MTAPGVVRSAGPHATCLLAPNPGPMTLEGTNTWVLTDAGHGPGGGDALVVDPGPDDDAHLAAVRSHLAGRGLSATGVVLTHGHADHSDGAARMSACLGAPLYAADPRWGEAVGEGDVLVAGAVRVRVLATPGHTADSLCLLLPGGELLTGDTVLGRGTSVIAHPDGALGPYLDSLERLRAMALAGEVAALLPGHGPDPGDPVSVLTGYLDHRRRRLAQVREAVAAGHTQADAVLEAVYSDVPEHLRSAARRSVMAQLKLIADGD